MIKENTIYVCCTSANRVEHILWKKVSSRWYVYFDGQEWIRSTMDSGTRSRLKKLPIYSF